MSISSERDNNILSGRGEKDTLRFVVYILSEVMSENKLMYLILWTVVVVFGAQEYFLLISNFKQTTDELKLLLNILTGIGAFTAPFIFVIIAVFPSFSDKIRSRLENISRTSGKPIAQSILDHFVFVLIAALTMMLLGNLTKYILEIELEIVEYNIAVSSAVISSLVAIVLMMSAAAIIELLRSVRTLYILIVADYTKVL